jgi:hypothetical protein
MSNKSLILAIKITLLFAGFSQVAFGGLNPSDIGMLIIFILLVASGNFKIGRIYLFFLFSTIYAFLIGGLSKPLLFFSEVFSFSILLLLFEYLKSKKEEEIIIYLKMFNY